MMFDPELYTISVRKESFDGELFYVARVAELADIEEYGETVEEARGLALDTLHTANEMCSEKGLIFPEPQEITQIDASGRITLRMPKSLHSNLIIEADKEAVSLNQLVVSRLSCSYGQSLLATTIANEIMHNIHGLRTEIKGYKEIVEDTLPKRTDTFQPSELVSSWSTNRQAMRLIRQHA